MGFSPPERAVRQAEPCLLPELSPDCPGPNALQHQPKHHILAVPRGFIPALMAIETLSISFDAEVAEVAEEVKHYAPDCGLWRLVNAAVRQYWRAIRLREAEGKLAAKYGPITEEAQRRAAAIE